MIPVVYVTPNFTANAVRFIEALASLHDIKLVVISQESTTLLPPWQQSRITLSKILPDVFDTQSLVTILSEIQKKSGPIHRLLGATEQLQLPLAQARKELGIQGMDPGTAYNFRDKSQMKSIFEQADIPCAKHSVATSLEEAILFAQRSTFPFVMKPVAGAGAQTTFRINNFDELTSAFENIGSEAGRGMIIEEFIQGDEFSLDTFSLNGKIIGQTINQYYPTPLEAMTNPWIQWRVILRKETTGDAFNDIRKFGKKALEVLGMDTGMSHMEWFRRKNGTLAISEVAARPPGAQFTTLISRACDFDAVKAWVRLMVYGDQEIPEIKYSCGAAYLRGPGHGKVSDVPGLEQMRSKYNHIITDIRSPKKGQQKSTSYEGEGFIIVRHPNSLIVENALEDIVNTVRVVYEK
ncbi:MAG TPA: ATP-grasp domain-containing protein [Saprospiraceae bacterium]|nr:ATP-grasp domain-containing protein [Saprospiraceae bacterium]